MSDPSPGRGAGGWPPWAKGLASAALAYHLAALLAGAAAVPPASPTMMAVAGWFSRYFGLVDAGYSYRYYAPEPPPTPVALATLTFKDGTERTLRIPDRSFRPRLRYQRYLSVANILMTDVEDGRREAEEPLPPGVFRDPNHRHDRWARSYARHLARRYKAEGCTKIALSVQMHLVPRQERVRELLAQPGASGVDLDAEEFYTVPERIGEFPCDSF